jgi:hypothetical protein
MNRFLAVLAACLLLPQGDPLLAQVPPNHPKFVVLPPVPQPLASFQMLLFGDDRPLVSSPYLVVRRHDTRTVVAGPLIGRWQGVPFGYPSWSFSAGRGLPAGAYDAAYYDDDVPPPDFDLAPPRAVFQFTVADDEPPTVVEYFNATLGHYFITLRADEIRRLDSGEITGWQRTGETFHAMPAFAAMPSYALPVCRYYGLPSAGIDSHFFSADPDECAAVAALWPDRWILEDRAAFAAVDVFPIECSDGLRPVFRLFNNRPDASHRYTVSPAIRDQMIAQGWIEEGPDFYPWEDRHAMCVPR